MWPEQVTDPDDDANVDLAQIVLIAVGLIALGTFATAVFLLLKLASTVVAL